MAHLKFCSRNRLPQKITQVVLKFGSFHEQVCVRINPGEQIIFDKQSQRDYLLKSTVKPLKTDTPPDKLQCPSYRSVRLIELIFTRNNPLGH